MLKSVVSHGAVYAALNALPLVVGMLALPIYARVLSAEAFGSLDLAVAVATFVTLTAPLEIAQGLARSYADAREHVERQRLASSALWFTVGAEAIALLVLLATGPWLSIWLFGTRTDLTLWLVVSTFVVAHGLYTLLSSQLRWRLQPWRYAAAIVVLTTTMHSVGIVLSAVLGFGLTGVLVGYLAGYAGAAAVAFVAARDDYRLHIDGAFLRRMLTFSLPLVPSSIAVILYLNADRLVLRQLLGLDAVGQYAILARFAFLVRPFILAGAMALIPVAVSRHQDPLTPVVIARFCRYLWCGVLGCVVLLTAIGPELMSTVVTDQYAGLAYLLPVLALAGALAELYVVAPGLFIARRTVTIALINTSSAVLNVALNLAFVPVLGIAGSCVGTLLSSGAALSFDIHAGQRHYPIPYPWRDIGGTAVVGGLAAGFMSIVGAGSAPWDAHSLVLRAVAACVALAVSAAWLLQPELRYIFPLRSSSPAGQL